MLLFVSVIFSISGLSLCLPDHLQGVECDPDPQGYVVPDPLYCDRYLECSPVGDGNILLCPPGQGLDLNTGLCLPLDRMSCDSRGSMYRSLSAPMSTRIVKPSRTLTLSHSSAGKTNAKPRPTTTLSASNLHKPKSSIVGFGTIRDSDIESDVLMPSTNSKFKPHGSPKSSGKVFSGESTLTSEAFSATGLHKPKSSIVGFGTIRDSNIESDDLKPSTNSKFKPQGSLKSFGKVFSDDSPSTLEVIADPFDEQIYESPNVEKSVLNERKTKISNIFSSKSSTGSKAAEADDFDLPLQAIALPDNSKLALNSKGVVEKSLQPKINVFGSFGGLNVPTSSQTPALSGSRGSNFDIEKNLIGSSNKISNVAKPSLITSGSLVNHNRGIHSIDNNDQTSFNIFGSSKKSKLEPIFEIKTKIEEILERSTESLNDVIGSSRSSSSTPTLISDIRPERFPARIAKPINTFGSSELTEPAVNIFGTSQDSSISLEDDSFDASISADVSLSHSKASVVAARLLEKSKSANSNVLKSLRGFVVPSKLSETSQNPQGQEPVQPIFTQNNTKLSISSNPHSSSITTSSPFARTVTVPVSASPRRTQTPSIVEPSRLDDYVCEGSGDYIVPDEKYCDRYLSCPSSKEVLCMTNMVLDISTGICRDKTDVNCSGRELIYRDVSQLEAQTRRYEEEMRHIMAAFPVKETNTESQIIGHIDDSLSSLTCNPARGDYVIPDPAHCDRYLSCPDGEIELCQKGLVLDLASNFCMVKEKVDCTGREVSYRLKLRDQLKAAKSVVKNKVSSSADISSSTVPIHGVKVNQDRHLESTDLDKGTIPFDRNNLTTESFPVGRLTTITELLPTSSKTPTSSLPIIGQHEEFLLRTSISPSVSTFTTMNVASSISSSCASGERLAHPSDCKLFYLCHGEGQKQLSSCAKPKVFNPVTGHCDLQERVPGCTSYYNNQVLALDTAGRDQIVASIRRQLIDEFGLERF